MKRIFFIVVVLLCIIVSGVSAQSSSKEAFQNSIIAFLRNDLELLPSIDSDGDIEFKDHEDETHYIRILSTSAPFFVILSRQGYTLTGDRGLSRREAILAANKTNSEVDAVKVYCSERSLFFHVEQYFQTVDDFKNVFFVNMEVLKKAENTFVVEYNRLRP